MFDMTDLIDHESNNPDLIATWQSTRSGDDSGARWEMWVRLVSPFLGQPSRAEAQAEIDGVLDDVLGVDTLDVTHFPGKLVDSPWNTVRTKDVKQGNDPGEYPDDATPLDDLEDEDLTFLREHCQAVYITAQDDSYTVADLLSPVIGTHIVMNTGQNLYLSVGNDEYMLEKCVTEVRAALAGE